MGWESGGGVVGGADILSWSQVSQGPSVQLLGFSEVSLSVPKGLGLAISVSTNFTFIFIFMDSPRFVSLFCFGCEDAMAPAWSSKALLAGVGSLLALCGPGKRAQVARLSCQAPLLSQSFH